MATNGNFYSGTSGLVLPVPQALYPETFQGKSRLAYYASLFRSVEINSSFYKLPKISTVKNWAESVGDDFKFTFKLSKAVTHVKGLDFIDEDIHRFIEIINHVGNKKGCLLIQFPPGLIIEYIDRVQHLLEVLKASDPGSEWPIAMEFRNPSWYRNEIFNLLQKHNISIVIHDLPESQTPLLTSTMAMSYFRFHGPGGKYRGCYTDDFLLEYAQRIQRMLSAGSTVHCFFNNTMGDALKNLQTLNRMVKEQCS